MECFSIPLELLRGGCSRKYLPLTQNNAIVLAYLLTLPVDSDGVISVTSKEVAAYLYLPVSGVLQAFRMLPIEKVQKKLGVERNLVTGLKIDMEAVNEMLKPKPWCNPVDDPQGSGQSAGIKLPTIITGPLTCIGDL